MKYRLAIGALIAVALQIWIIRLGIFGVPKPPGVPSMWSRVPRPSNPASATDAPGVAVAVAPLPSVDQSMKFWSDAERTGRLDTNLAVKKYFFDLAMNHRIPVKASSGAVVGEIVVPGDVSGLNWNATDTQFARLAESGVPVEITPPMLQELKLRRDKFLALSKIPFSGPPPERTYP
jgi:hypothetical protein